MEERNTHPFNPAPESVDSVSERDQPLAGPEEQRIEQAATASEAPSQPTVSAEKGRAHPSALNMLFREAEVIAQNLKESGTRR
jgi:hypothetical protein